MPGRAVATTVGAVFEDAVEHLAAHVATLQVDDGSVEAMIRRADAALYTAKNAGRDRVSAIVA